MNERYEYVIRFRYPWSSKIQVSRTNSRARLEKLQSQQWMGRKAEILSVKRVPCDAYEDITDEVYALTLAASSGKAHSKKGGKDE